MDGNSAKWTCSAELTGDPQASGRRLSVSADAGDCVGGEPVAYLRPAYCWGRVAVTDGWLPVKPSSPGTHPAFPGRENIVAVPKKPSPLNPDRRKNIVWEFIHNSAGLREPSGIARVPDRLCFHPRDRPQPISHRRLHALHVRARFA
ncbi:hypothetical protein BaRGS_00032543 [Batillaria attramentaria]|uniref:Uncharacterized protein n=1 Tax=Batillaria attramentaria TaxID=370345 RepID=A0ABD0JMW9_9CAEN